MMKAYDKVCALWTVVVRWRDAMIGITVIVLM